MTRTLRALSLAAAVALGASLAGDPAIDAAAPSPRALGRLDAALRGVVARGATRPQRVIIRVRPGGLAALRQTLAARGVQEVAEHPSINAITAVVAASDLPRLADAENTLSVSADAVVHPTDLLGSLVSTTTNLVETIGNVILPGGADTAGPAVAPWVVRQTLGVQDLPWSGRGVGVAVIDSGIEMSSEFNGRLLAYYDMTGGRMLATTPSDEYGHGTHVAGIIAGSGGMSSGRAYHGLAPNARLLVLKVLDGRGAGYTSDVIRAIDFVVDNRARYGISVINLSLGHPIGEPAATDPLVQAVERAARAGIVVCVAAGNLGVNPTTGRPGYAGITSPGNAPSAITVGGARTLDTVGRGDDRIPDYSSAGPTWYDAYVKPDLLAPGHNVVSVGAKRSWLYTTYPQLRAADADYIRLSGTSMATAVASGSVALLLEASEAAHPGAPPLTPNAVKAVLQYTAVNIHDDLGVPYDPLRRGAGALNTAGGITLGSAIDTAMPVGSMWLTYGPVPWTIVGGQPLFWAQQIIWRDRVVWGSVTAVNEPAWGPAVIWGSTNTWGSAVIWGSNIVWTEPDTWGSAVIWGSDSLGYTDGSAVIWGSSDSMTASNTEWKDVGGAASTGTAVGQ